MGLELYYELSTSYMPMVSNCSRTDMTRKYIFADSPKIIHWSMQYQDLMALCPCSILFSLLTQCMDLPSGISNCSDHEQPEPPVMTDQGHLLPFWNCCFLERGSESRCHLRTKASRNTLLNGHTTGTRGSIKIPKHMDDNVVPVAYCVRWTIFYGELAWYRASLDLHPSWLEPSVSLLRIVLMVSES